MKYLIIKYLWEGFELVHPYINAEDTKEALIATKLLVKDINKKADEINGDWDDTTDDELHSPWTKLLIGKKIEYSEYKIGADEKPEDYCAQKWDPKEKVFICACKELGLDDKHRF